MTQPAISTLREGDGIRGTLLISDQSLARTRHDKPYLRCTLADRTGSLPARMWDIDEAAWKALARARVAEVEGAVESYQDTLQIVLRSIRPGRPDPDLMRRLLPASARDPDEMLAEVERILGTLEHPFMRALARAYLDDQKLMERFCRCPAASKLHHAHLGGLLEHVLTLLQLADAICPVYPRVSRDIVLIGLLAHDMGKTVELSWETGFEYTERGQLVGHVVDGAHILRLKMREAAKTVSIPPGLADVLEHIVLSHHGLPEFGAVKVPATPEAILVSMIDNLDAKTTMALAAARGEGIDPDQAFTEKVWALGTRLHTRDPLGANGGEGLFGR